MIYELVLLGGEGGVHSFHLKKKFMKYLLQQRCRTTQSCRHNALLSSSGPDSIKKVSQLARRANRSRQRQVRQHTVGLLWPRAGGPTASLLAEFGQRPSYSAVRKSQELE